MDLRSGASRNANVQKQGEPGSVDMVLPKELQEQVEAITKSSRIADGIKRVITAITRELQSLRLENIGLRQELDSVRKYLSRRIKDFKQIGCLRREEVVAFSPVDKANMLADHFESVFQEDDGKVPDWFSPSVEPMKEFPWFIASELYELIMEWPSSSSVTTDFVPFFVVQRIAAVICGPLAYISNQSLCFGEVPLRWKHSFVTPLLKKEPSWNPENYRPEMAEANGAVPDVAENQGHRGAWTTFKNLFSRVLLIYLMVTMFKNFFLEQAVTATYASS
nr:RNA-directed DNA polymerase from mobile element [Haemonchus contortus]